MVNKKAGFWIKLLSRLIDILPVAAISITSAFLMMSHTPIDDPAKNVWHFENPWEFYVWGVLLVLMLVLQFLVVPLFNKGKTFGQWTTRIKIVANEGELRVAILKREAFFSMAWIFSSILVIALVNHTLIYKYASSDQSDITYTTLESLRIGIVSVVGSITTLIQMIIGISVLVRKDKKGLHDVYAKTSVVYINKFIAKPEFSEDKITRPQPVPQKNVPVEWIK